jgi:hypothetical protein
VTAPIEQEHLFARDACRCAEQAVWRKQHPRHGSDVCAWCYARREREAIRYCGGG